MKKVIILFLFIFCCINICFAINRGEIREQIRYIIQDTTSTTNSYRWSDDILNKRINMAQDTIVNDTRCLWGQSFTTATVNVSEYTKPTDCMILKRVSYHIVNTTATYKKLTYASIETLDRDFPMWENGASGNPLYYYERGKYIGLYPKPSSTFAGNNYIKFDYFKTSTDMTSDSDIPYDNVPSLSPYHDIIIYFVVIMCKKDNHEDYTTYLQEYLKMINDMVTSINTLPDQKQVIKVQNA